MIRKFTRNRKQYPNEESALKLVYLAIHEASKKWTMPIPKWRGALNHFAIIFEDRLPARPGTDLASFVPTHADTKKFTSPLPPGIW